MTNPATTKTRAAKVANPAAAAKAATAKPAAKAAPAKVTAKAAPKTEAPKGVKLSYIATGRDGRDAVRSSDRLIFTFAVDLADPTSPKQRDRTGKVVRFFPTKDGADAWASAQRDLGYDAKVVAARPMAD